MLHNLIVEELLCHFILLVEVQVVIDIDLQLLLDGSASITVPVLAQLFKALVGSILIILVKGVIVVAEHLVLELLL
jgi:hypothetical protein